MWHFCNTSARRGRPRERFASEGAVGGRGGAEKTRYAGSHDRALLLPVLLTVTTTHWPPSDLGYLLHKHPDKVQSFPVASARRAHGFYPVAKEEECAATLLLDVGPSPWCGAVVPSRGGTEHDRTRTHVLFLAPPAQLPTPVFVAVDSAAAGQIAARQQLHVSFTDRYRVQSMSKSTTSSAGTASANGVTVPETSSRATPVSTRPPYPSSVPGTVIVTVTVVWPFSGRR